MIFGLTGDDASWFAGIASIFVGIVAILVAIFGKRITNYFFGPKLSMEFSDEWECAEDGDYGKMFGGAASGIQDARVIRVKVVNAGKESATKCYGKITRLYFNGSNQQGFFEQQGFIPVHLLWASRQNIGASLFKSKSQIDLAPGDADYLDVCVCWKNNEEKLMPWSAYPYGADKYLPAGQYVFQISLFCNNSSAKSIKLEIDHTGKWFELHAKETR